jgi:hypothetical protein
MMADVNNNKTLKVLGSHVTGGHPIFGNEDNDKFRAVHDFFGHAATGRDFDRHGEHATYLAHGKMFTPDALPALTTETLGQNSSLILNGHFGPNKIGTIPRELTASRTAMPSEYDVYDGFYDEDEYDPDERPEPHEGPWYHYSPTKMPVGTHLTSGHDSPWGDNLYEKDGTEHRRNYVWLSPTVTEAVYWAGATPNKGDNGRGYVYRVEPSSNVLPWNGTGSDGWVADGAHIAEELPHPWKEPHTAARLAAHEHVESGQRGRPDWTGCAHPECRSDLPTVMYHTSHPRNRDSIAQHGLLASYSQDNDESDAYGLPHGIYMTPDLPKHISDPQYASKYATDIWAIDTSKLQHLENDMPGGLIAKQSFATKYDIPSSALRLHERSPYHSASHTASLNDEEEKEEESDGSYCSKCGEDDSDWCESCGQCDHCDPEHEKHCPSCGPNDSDWCEDCEECDMCDSGHEKHCKYCGPNDSDWCGSCEECKNCDYHEDHCSSCGPGDSDWCGDCEQCKYCGDCECSEGSDAEPMHYNTPLMRRDERPTYYNDSTGMTEYYFSPNEINPASVALSRPKIEFPEPEDEDPTLDFGSPLYQSNGIDRIPAGTPGMKLFRGLSVNLKHPDLAPLRRAIFGDEKESYYSGTPNSHYPGPSREERSQGYQPGMFPGMFSDKELAAPMADPNELDGHLKSLLDHMSVNYRKGLGRHWSTSHEQSKGFAGMHANDTTRFARLPVMLKGYWKGQGENPYRHETGESSPGDYDHEQEMNLLPGAPIHLTDVQILHPKTKQWHSMMTGEPVRIHANTHKSRF